MCKHTIHRKTHPNTTHPHPCCIPPPHASPSPANPPHTPRDESHPPAPHTCRAPVPLPDTFVFPVHHLLPAAAEEPPVQSAHCSTQWRGVQLPLQQQMQGLYNCPPGVVGWGVVLGWCMGGVWVWESATYVQWCMGHCLVHHLDCTTTRRRRRTTTRRRRTTRRRATAIASTKPTATKTKPTKPAATKPNNHQRTLFHTYKQGI